MSKTVEELQEELLNKIEEIQNLNDSIKQKEDDYTELKNTLNEKDSEIERLKGINKRYYEKLTLQENEFNNENTQQETEENEELTINSLLTNSGYNI